MNRPAFRCVVGTCYAGTSAYVCWLSALSLGSFLPFDRLRLPGLRQQQVQRAHPGSQAKQNDYVARVGSSTVLPPLNPNPPKEGV